MGEGVPLAKAEQEQGASPSRTGLHGCCGLGSVLCVTCYPNKDGQADPRARPASELVLCGTETVSVNSEALLTGQDLLLLQELWLQIPELWQGSLQGWILMENC